MPYLSISSACSAVMRSPMTAMGTAGGQVTAAEAITRPAASPAGTISRAREQGLAAGHDRLPGSGNCQSLTGSSGRKSAKAAEMRSKSRISFSGVSIITSQSGSANSHSQPYSRSLADNSYPLYPALCAAMVILSGSDSAHGHAGAGKPPLQVLNFA